jgi:hypothetical protein
MMQSGIYKKAELLLEKLTSDPKLSRYVDKKRPIPKVFQGSGEIKLVFLGQDPTVKDIASRDKIKTVLNLDKSENLRNYLNRICTRLGLNLDENAYATNYFKNFFIKPPTQIKDIDIFKEFSPGWLHILVDELNHFPGVPIITLGEPLHQLLVNYGVSPKVRDYWGYTPNWKQGETGELKMLKPEQNILNRLIFPFPHQPSLMKKIYKDRLERYIDFVKAECFSL